MMMRIWISSCVFVAACATDDRVAVDHAELTKCSHSGAVVYGVDVSNYQGASIDWSAAHATGRDFGFAKASEGTGFTDGAFAHNWPAMRGAGVLRGAYHFFRPGSDGVAQANHFVDVIEANGGLADGDLPPVADVEVSDDESPGTVVARLAAFLDQVQARTGRVPLIYTANFFWGSYLGNPDFIGYPLWVANYGPSCPYLPNAWSDWAFWQYSDNDGVDGIPGGVDGDMFNGSLDELRAFAGAGGGSSSGDFQMGRRTIANRDGRLEIFARASDGSVWHDWQGAPNGSWDGWNLLGGVTSSNPVVAADADGRLEVFAIAGGHLYHTFQLADASWYAGWLDEGDGNLIGEPAALQNADGRLEVFARTTAGNLQHIWQTSPNGGWSTGWADAGGVVTSNPGIGRNADGRLEVFALGGDSRLYHIWQTAPNAGWSDWGGFGDLALRGTPHVGPNADGRLEVFAAGADDRLHHIAEVPGGGWSDWMDGGDFGVAGEPALGRNADGRLEVFARGTDGALWHSWQLAPNSGWSAGEPFGGTSLASDPDVGRNADGRLEVFWRAPAGSIETVFEQVGGGWSPVVDFGGNLADF